VIVTLSQLGNPSSIQKVTIQNNATAATTMYFDDIKLANVIVSGSSSRASGSVMQNEVDTELKNWRVFPNPAKDHVNIEFNAEQSGVIVAELIDYTGRTIYKKTFTVSAGYNQKQIKTTSLSSGLYYLRINNDKHIKTEPIVIQ